MIHSVDDALIAFGLAVALMARPMLSASHRRMNFLARLSATAVYQVGTAVALVWLISAYGWTAVWSAVGDFPTLSIGPMRLLVVVMFYLALASPVIAAGLVIDTFRHRYMSVRTEVGKFLIPVRYVRTADGSKILIVAR